MVMIVRLPAHPRLGVPAGLNELAMNHRNQEELSPLVQELRFQAVSSKI
jgi:hypothetical protein